MMTRFTLPHDPLTPLNPTSRPTARTVRILGKALYATLCGISSNLGGGNHGHLPRHDHMPQVDYTAISNGGALYVHPVPPAPVDIYPLPGYYHWSPTRRIASMHNLAKSLLPIFRLSQLSFVAATMVPSSQDEPQSTATSCCWAVVATTVTKSAKPSPPV